MKRIQPGTVLFKCRELFSQGLICMNRRVYFAFDFSDVTAGYLGQFF